MSGYKNLKSSPWVWIALAGAFVVILIMTKGGGGQSSAAGQASVATLASSNAANVQLAGLSTQLQAKQIDANSTRYTTMLNDQTAITLAGYKAGNQSEITQSGLWASTLGAVLSYATNGNNNSTALAAQSQNLAYTQQNHRDTIAATSYLAPIMATIQATSLQNLSTLQGNVAMHASDNQVRVSQHQDETAMAMAQIAGANQQAVAQIQASSQGNLANIASGAAQAKSSTDALGSIASAAIPIIASFL